MYFRTVDELEDAKAEDIEIELEDGESSEDEEKVRRVNPYRESQNT